MLVDIPLVLLVDPSLGHLVLLASSSRELICAHVLQFPIFIWNGMKSFVSGFNLSCVVHKKYLAKTLQFGSKMLVQSVSIFLLDL